MLLLPCSFQERLHRLLACVKVSIMILSLDWGWAFAADHEDSEEVTRPVRTDDISVTQCWVVPPRDFQSTRKPVENVHLNPACTSLRLRKSAILTFWKLQKPRKGEVQSCLPAV